MEHLYTISLTAAELNILYQGLGELQLKTAVGVFGSLQRQILAQDVPPTLQSTAASAIVS